jgi:hypothetical protein
MSNGGCKGICERFNGYRSGRGQCVYKDGYIYCRSCECGYKFISNFCPCCHHRVRKQTWNGHNRKTRLETTLRIE